MECMEARALKSSLLSEVAMKTTNPQGTSDDFWCVAGLPIEDFSIDEFFDLPNDEKKDGSFLEEEEEEEEEKDSYSLSLSSQDPIDDIPFNSPNFSPDLAIPVDDLQELELWSHFMDDSVPEATLACPKPTISDTQKNKSGIYLENRVEPGKKKSNGGVGFIPSAVPVKPRTKRPRTSENRAWKTDSSSSSSSSSSPVSTLLFPQVHDMRAVFNVGKPAPKKPKRKSASGAGESGGGSAVQRRCSHCQVTKTPQWRAGPNGPKTLCNACGVRFKSGRLFPEYRPACSPTFSNEVHSNSHRKVLEMRRKKELTESSTGSTPTVESISVS